MSSGSSSLAKQLKAIQQEDRKVRGVLAGQKKRPSFLFDEKEAADYDDESILALGREGFMALCKEDAVLEKFGEGLFGVSLLKTDLSMLTKIQVEQYEKEVGRFLILISPHFLKKSAQKALEWMIRKWRVNETCIDALMVSILPFHETPEFVRMVQIVYFTKDSRWSFLFERVKQKGLTIGRKILAQRCTVDGNIIGLIMGFFDSVCRERIEHATNGQQWGLLRTFASFVTFILLEMISWMPVISDSEGIAFYYRIETMLKQKEFAESIVGAMMVFMSLCEKVALSEAAINAFLKKLTKLSTTAPQIERNIILTIIRTIEGHFVDHLDESVAVFVANNMVILDDVQREFKTSRSKSILMEALCREENHQLLKIISDKDF